jgi:hypothetical protein
MGVHKVSRTPSEYSPEVEFINRLLEGLRLVRPGLFEPGINIADGAYSFFLSLRRGPNTEAISAMNNAEATIIGR